MDKIYLVKPAFDSKESSVIIFIIITYHCYQSVICIVL